MLLDYDPGRGRFLLRTSYSERDLAKSLGGRWLPKEKCWLLPRSADIDTVACVSSTTPAAQRELESRRLRRERLAAIRHAEDAEVAHGDGLDPYQRVGVKFLAEAGRAVLSDFAGAGKTAQAVRAALEVGARRILVVTKKSLVYNWLCEIEKWSGRGALR